MESALNLSAFPGCSWPPGDRGPRWNLRQKLDWIFRVKLRLALAQASALPRIARRLWRPPQCHRAYLPLLRSSAWPTCGQSRQECACSPPRRPFLMPFFFFFLNPKQPTEVSQRLSSFTKTNPVWVHWSKGWILALWRLLLQSEWGTGVQVYCWVHGPKGTRRRKRRCGGWKWIESGVAAWPPLPEAALHVDAGSRELKDPRGRGGGGSLVFQASEKNGLGQGFGAIVGRFAIAKAFLCEAHHPLSVIVNMCILSNKIQLVRLFWAVLVTNFRCCDCSEDRVALTTVRSPNKIHPQNLKKKKLKCSLNDFGLFFKQFFLVWMIAT